MAVSPTAPDIFSQASSAVHDRERSPLSYYARRVRKPLRLITQHDMNTYGQELYPGVKPDTLNRQLWTPLIAVWNHAVALE